jgi:hypothetical protein
VTLDNGLPAYLPASLTACMCFLACCRDRERNITWTYQWLCMAPIAVGALLCDTATQPHLERAVSRTSTLVARYLQQLHGTHAASAAAQLLQPAAEVVLGPRLLRAVCYQGPPAAAAAVSGIMAHLHAARRVLCHILRVPESPMRAFWRLRGKAVLPAATLFASLAAAAACTACLGSSSWCLD